jgi:hypothetical protein
MLKRFSLVANIQIHGWTFRLFGRTVKIWIER